MIEVAVQPTLQTHVLTSNSDPKNSRGLITALLLFAVTQKNAQKELMSIKVIGLFLKKSSFYIYLFSLFLNKESKKAIKYSVFQALYKISCYIIILIIVLKLLSIFTCPRWLLALRLPLKAAGLASFRTPFIAK